MIRVAIDTDVQSALTGHVQFLMTYSDQVHTHAALSTLQNTYPHSTIILVDRGLGDPTGLATIADVETGALKPSGLPAWHDRKHAAGLTMLTVYCNRQNLQACLAALAGRHMFVFVATLDGTVFVEGYDPLFAPDLVQILPASKVGRHADLSLVLADTWHPDQVPHVSQLAKLDILTARASCTEAAGKLTDALSRLGG